MALDAQQSTDALADESDEKVSDTNSGAQKALAASTDLADSKNSSLIQPTTDTVEELPLVIFTGHQPDELFKFDPPAEGEKGTVKKDEQGRVIEIAYPDGKTRVLGYGEDGQLNKVVQPDGTTLVLKDGRWTYQPVSKPGQNLGGGEKGKGAAAGAGDVPKNVPEADFSSPEVNADGTFSWETKDGSRQVEFIDGTSANFTKDGTKIFSDLQGRVTDITYANGDSRRFTYGPDGRIATVNENGTEYKLRDGELVGHGDSATGLKDPRVAKDGTYIVDDATGVSVAKMTDGTSEEYREDHSIVKKNADGHITEIEYPDGGTRKFEYNGRGDLSSITDPDGKVYKAHATPGRFNFFVKDFQADDGSVRTALVMKPDGTMQYVDKDGKIHADFTSGNSTTTSKTSAEINEIASRIHDSNALGGSAKEVRKSIASLDDADRVALAAAYERLYGDKLTDKLRIDAKDKSDHDNAVESLLLLSDAHLRTTILKKFSDPEQLKHAQDTVDGFRQRAREQGVPAADVAAAEAKAAKYLESKPGSASEQLKELEKNLGAIAPSIESLALEYGVKYDEVQTSDGRHVRHYYVEGENGVKLPVIDSGSDNPLEIERQLKEFRDQKEQAIEQNYNVEFSADGQKDAPLGKTVDLRSPRIDELLALEKGLEHSQPSTSTNSRAPILVQFAVQPTSGNDAYVLGKDGGQQRILFEPLNRSFRGLEDTILHEWAHNAEHNTEIRDPAALKEFYESQGYRSVKVKDANGLEIDQWQLRDKDGNYWMQGPGQAPFGIWSRVDEKGRPLRNDGSLATTWDDPMGAHRENREMAEAAAVRPASNYHPHPAENGAEAIRMLRGDEASRKALFVSSPDLYAAAIKFDQNDLDNDPAYGRNGDGTSKYIRLPDGTVGRNNEENRKRVAEFEQRLNDPPPERSRSAREYASAEPASSTATESTAATVNEGSKR